MFLHEFDRRVPLCRRRIDGRQITKKRPQARYTSKLSKPCSILHSLLYHDDGITVTLTRLHTIIDNIDGYNSGGDPLDDFEGRTFMMRMFDPKNGNIASLQYDHLHVHGTR